MERDMEKVAVIHTAFEDKPTTVAFVEIPNDAESVIDKLNFAYRWTQNIMDSWSLKMPGDSNDKVTVVGDISNGKGLRSTSVGDQILVGTEKYVVARMGFETLDGESV
tara:strand:- start:1603 stop:1926 length:324 start_codon:yes stop_codon:yes gene_type:complete